MKKQLLTLLFLAPTCVQQTLAEDPSPQEIIIARLRSAGSFVTELTAGSIVNVFYAIMQKLSIQERKDFYRESLLEQIQLIEQIALLAKDKQWDVNLFEQLQLVIQQNTLFGAACAQETREVQQELAAQGLL